MILLRRLLFCIIIAPITFSLSALADVAKTSVRIKEIRSGDTLYSLLRQNGFNENQLRAVLSKKIVPKHFTLAQKQKYKVSRSPQSQKTEIKLYDSSDDLSYIFWRDGKKTSGARVQTEDYDSKVIKVEGKVKGSLISSIMTKISDIQIAYRFIDAFILEYKVPKSLKRGAKFSITYEKLYDRGHFVKHGEILNAQLEIKGKLVEKNFVKTPLGGAFISEENDFSKRPFFSPVAYQRITSLYQPRRFHPIKRRRQPHLGIDFELKEGEKVFSVQSGKVKAFGKKRGAGRYVVIQHENGYTSFYNHLQSFAPNLKKGQLVRRGEFIATIGCTGYCTKPHLHFALKKNGRYVNPIKYIKSFAAHQMEAVLEKVNKAL